MHKIEKGTHYIAAGGGILTVTYVYGDLIKAIQSTTGRICEFTREEFGQAAMYVVSKEEAKKELSR